VARHESEARRGTTKTTLLPWGVLASHIATRLPQKPDTTIARTSVLWGLAGSVSSDAQGRKARCLLPGGLLFRSTTGPGESTVHILGTGISRKQATPEADVITRFRLLGLPLWSTSTPAPRAPKLTKVITSDASPRLTASGRGRNERGNSSTADR